MSLKLGGIIVCVHTSVIRQMLLSGQSCITKFCDTIVYLHTSVNRSVLYLKYILFSNLCYQDIAITLVAKLYSSLISYFVIM